MATDGLGVNIHFTHPMDGELEMIAAGGFKWIREDFVWSATEKTKGTYNFSEYEHLKSALEKNKIRPIFILDYNNDLYVKDGHNAVITAENRAAYARWAAAAVEHFKGREILWEIWNEPNGDGFWGGHPNATQYSEMALEAIKAIRAKTPNEVIIGPAISWFDWKWIEEYLKTGILNHFDAFSIHPYGISQPEMTESYFQKLRHMMSQYGLKDKTLPIISSEWGYSATEKNLDAQIQAKYLPRTFLSNIMNNISISIWYDWHDDCTNAADHECAFGTVAHEYHSGHNPVYTPKPGYLAVKTLASVLNGYHYVKRIATNDSNDYVLLFSNDVDLRMALWTSSLQSHEITIPSIVNSNVEMIDSKGDHFTITINDSPQYIIVKGQNHALLNAPEAHHFKVTVNQAHGKQLPITIQNIHETAFNGIVQLTDVKGIEPSVMKINLQFSNGEYEKTIKVELKSIPENDYSVGMHIEGHGMVLFIPVQRFVTPSKNLLTGCKIIADGDAKIKSEQSVSVHPAPEPLSDSNSTVLKVDYHFFGEGWKFFRVFPNDKDWHIPDEPKALGMWIYGDGRAEAMKIRVGDASHQYFQYYIGAPYQKIDWKGWKYFNTDLNNLEGVEHWGGANDGKLHYPLFWDTLILLDHPNNLDVNSTIYVTAPVFIY